jgi:hypothetical protein
MRLSARDLDNPLVSQGLQDSGSEHFLGPAVSRCAEGARSVAKDVSISRQVQRVLPTARDLLQVAHLLGSSKLSLSAVPSNKRLLSLDLPLGIVGLVSTLEAEQASVDVLISVQRLP